MWSYGSFISPWTQTSTNVSMLTYTLQCNWMYFVAHFVFLCLFTTWLMCTDCRLLTWPLWILLATCVTACNTDRCCQVKTQRQILGDKLCVVWLAPTWPKSNCVVCVHLTCCVACTGWTTWVGTPGAGGQESDRLSLEWTEPSRVEREGGWG